MEIVLVGVVIAGFVAVVVLFAMIRDNANAVESLRQQLAALHRADLQRQFAPPPQTAPPPASQPSPYYYSPPPDRTPPAPAPTAAPVPAPVPDPVAAPETPPESSDIPPATDLETRIGARVTVWVGALALLLGAGYLVKFSIDAGWFPPAVRVYSGLAFGGVIGAAATLLRDRAPYVSQGLLATALAVFYASLWASCSMFDVLPAGVAFSGMALVTAAGLLPNRTSGPVSSSLAVLLGMLAPVLTADGPGHPALLFGYILMLQTLALVAAWRNGRWWLMLLSLGGGTLWFLTWIATEGTPEWLALYLLCSGVLHLVVLRRWKEITGLAAVLAVGGSTLCLALGGFTPLGWTLFAVTLAGGLALARGDTRFAPLAPVVAVAAFIATAAIPTTWHVIIPGVAAVLALTACSTAKRGHTWFGTSAVLLAPAVLLTLLVVHHGAFGALPADSTGVLLSVGALVLVVLAAVTSFRRTRTANDLTLNAATASAALVLLVLGIGMAVLTGSTVLGALVWLVLMPAAALAFRLERWPAALVVTWIGGVISVGLLGVPGSALLAFDAETPLWNGMTGAYAAGIAAALFTARMLRHAPVSLAAARLVALWAVLWGGSMVGLQAMQWVPGWNMSVPSAMELSVLVSFWMAVAAVIIVLRRECRVMRSAGLVLGAAAGMVLLFGPMIGMNPWLSREAVSGLPVLNTLLLTYGVPALMLLALGWVTRRNFAAYAYSMNWAALLVALVLAAMQVRHAFQGAELWAGQASYAEGYALSAVWGVMAVALLVAGMLSNRKQVRIAGLVVLTLVAGKVFIHDLAHLRELYRVLSFMGLGVAMMGTAYMYHRFVQRLNKTETVPLPEYATAASAAIED